MKSINFTKQYNRIFLLAGLLALDSILTISQAAVTDKIEAPINANGCPATLDFKLRKLAEKDEINLCDSYKGKVVLIVNTASKCGFTDQFGELEKIYGKYKDKGFVVLGFPANDFANQDPENEKNIAKFCRLTYGVKFPMFEKTHAAKKTASPLYQTLGNLSGEFPRWNFHKYILDTNGNLVASFPSQVSPTDRQLLDIIKKHLPE